MEQRRLRSLLPLLPILLALAAPTSLAASLQELIDATPAGGILRLAPGTYAGPAAITRPLTLDGGGKVSILGAGRGTVLSVAANGVTLRGLHISGSGELHDSVDAGILLEGDDHRVEGNVIEDTLFGIHLKQVNRSRVVGNRVTGKNLEQGMRGDAIRLWYSRHNVVEGNRFTRARDLTFANSADNRIVGNRFDDGRYGMHIIFSPRLLVENNRLADTGTGIIVLYSPDLVLRGNHVAHALTAGGGGIVFKESHDALVENNEVLHCSVGLRVDAPPESAGKLTVRNNRFAHNIIGLFFYGEEGGHRFTDNRFENNLTTVGDQRAGRGQRQQMAAATTGTSTRASTATTMASATRRTRSTCSPTASGWKPRSPPSSATRRCWKCSISSNAWRRSPPRTSCCAIPRRACAEPTIPIRQPRKVP
jgi:nitrous oxidase accessory protein